MRNRLKTVLLAALLAPMLSGCFTSEKPLITPLDADYPLKAGAKLTFTAISYRTGGAVREKGKSSRVKFIVVGKNSPNMLPPGRYYGDEDTRSQTLLLFKHFDDAFYIVEYLVQEPKKPRAAITYTLASIEGGKIRSYPMACHPFDTDSKFVQSGLLHAVKGSDSASPCTVDNLEGLQTIFRARLAAGALPNGEIIAR